MTHDTQDAPAGGSEDPRCWCRCHYGLPLKHTFPCCVDGTLRPAAPSHPMACRLCGKGAHDCGGWLERVNEKGVPGVWECRPSCGAKLSKDEAVIGAVEGPSRQEPRERISTGAGIGRDSTHKVVADRRPEQESGDRVTRPILGPCMYGWVTTADTAVYQCVRLGCNHTVTVPFDPAPPSPSADELAWKAAVALREARYARPPFAIDMTGDEARIIFGAIGLPSLCAARDALTEEQEARLAMGDRMKLLKAQLEDRAATIERLEKERDEALADHHRNWPKCYRCVAEVNEDERRALLHEKQEERIATLEAELAAERACEDCKEYRLRMERENAAAKIRESKLMRGALDKYAVLEQREAGLREALAIAAIPLEALRISVEWELSPFIKHGIAEAVDAIRAALSPACVPIEPAAPEKDRPCTCHSDDNPPVPCPRKYALTECRAAAQVEAPAPASGEKEEQHRRAAILWLRDRIRRDFAHRMEPTIGREWLDQKLSTDWLVLGSAPQVSGSEPIPTIEERASEMAYYAWQHILFELSPEERKARLDALDAALRGGSEGGKETR